MDVLTSLRGSDSDQKTPSVIDQYSHDAVIRQREPALISSSPFCIHQQSWSANWIHCWTIYVIKQCSEAAADLCWSWQQAWQDWYCSCFLPLSLCVREFVPHKHWFCPTTGEGGSGHRRSVVSGSDYSSLGTDISLRVDCGYMYPPLLLKMPFSTHQFYFDDSGAGVVMVLFHNSSRRLVGVWE